MEDARTIGFAGADQLDRRHQLRRRAAPTAISAAGSPLRDEGMAPTRCGVAWVAVTNPLLYLESSWWIRDDISDSGHRHSLGQMVGDAKADAKADAEMLDSVSPVAQAARIRAPLFLAIGEADLRVPLAHGKRLRESLRESGREPQWVGFPDESHSWRLPQTHSDFARRMANFLAEQLRDVPAN